MLFGVYRTTATPGSELWSCQTRLTVELQAYVHVPTGPRCQGRYGTPPAMNYGRTKEGTGWHFKIGTSKHDTQALTEVYGQNPLDTKFGLCYTK